MTNELRQFIRNRLVSISGYQVYYQLGDEDAVFPHIVFQLDSASKLMDDFNRRDYNLIIDIYFRKESRVDIENLCDNIIYQMDKYNVSHLPTILPTFIFTGYRVLIDEDKNIDRRQITFDVQTYERVM